MLRSPGILTLGVAATFLGCGGPSGAPAEPAVEVDHLAPEEISDAVLTSMDPSADPCQDFYRYACGGWIDQTELPSDQARWARSFSVIQERNRERLRSLLEEAATAADPQERKAGEYYAACMDETAAEERGITPLEPFLGRIDELSEARNALTVAAELHRRGLPVLFGSGVVPDFRDPTVDIALYSQGGLGLPERGYYLRDDERSVGIRTQYREHVARMLEFLGEDAEQAAADADVVLAFESRLAESSRPPAEMRDLENLYHRLDRQGLEELTPELPWPAYFQAIGYPDLQPINVAVPEFFEGLQATLKESDPEAVKSYLRWQLINDTAPWLTAEIAAADHDFYGRVLSGQQEQKARWKRCVAATDRAMGELVGRLFVERYFAGDSKAVALEMIGDIQDAFRASLPGLAWMDDQTRQRADEKAEAVVEKIGYPDHWRDYSALEVTAGDHFASLLAAGRFEYRRNQDKIGRPVDRTEWFESPPTVNAYYNPLFNEIVFPAGILQPPFFHRDFPAAMNYGAIGSVFGHELTHGFDDKGRKFDPLGRMKSWWEPEAGQGFEERAACVADQASGFEVEPGLSLDGKLTLGENIADLGGLKESSTAYGRWVERHGAPAAGVGDLTGDQLFFVAYAQSWCLVQAPEQARMRVRVDPHAHPRFRVVGPLSNLPAFAAAFSCQEGEPMVHARRCEVW